MKKKNSMVCILMALLVLASLVLFSGCGAKEETEALPTEANPASDSASVSEPEEELEPQSRFDEYVTQYEQENEVSLVEAHDSIKYDFFDEIYMQNYTRTEAIEDKEVTTEANQGLLDRYIEYLDSMQHTECGFDDIVNHVLQEIAKREDAGYTFTEEKLDMLFDELLIEGITPDDIEQWGCDNPYAQGYIDWFNKNQASSTTAETETKTLTPEEYEELVRQAEASWQETQEEEARELAEAEQWMEENFDLYG